MTQSLSQVSLYEQDFALWIDDTVAKLKAGKFEQLEIENLIEEIECLGRSDKRELKNRFVVLLEHLLKRIYIDSPNDYRGWMNTIREQRRQIRFLLEDSPSLKNFAREQLSSLYLEALTEARSKYEDAEFPNEWQFSSEIDALLNETFWEN